MQNNASKERFNQFNQIISNRDFAVLFDLEKYYKQFLYSESLDEHISGIEFIFLYYIYYVMLSREERNIFPHLRLILVKNTTYLTSVFKTKPMLNQYNQTDWENDDIEQKLLFLLMAKILHMYDENSGFINEDNKNLDIVLLIDAIYESDYSKFQDNFLFIFFMAYGIFDITEYLSPSSCEKVECIFYSLINNTLENRLNPETSSAIEDICLDERMYNNAREMRLINK